MRAAHGLGDPAIRFEAATVHERLLFADDIDRSVTKMKEEEQPPGLLPLSRQWFDERLRSSDDDGGWPFRDHRSTVELHMLYDVLMMLRDRDVPVSVLQLTTPLLESVTEFVRQRVEGNRTVAAVALDYHDGVQRIVNEFARAHAKRPLSCPLTPDSAYRQNSVASMMQDIRNGPLYAVMVNCDHSSGMVNPSTIRDYMRTLLYAWPVVRSSPDDRDRLGYVRRGEIPTQDCLLDKLEDCELRDKVCRRWWSEWTNALRGVGNTTRSGRKAAVEFFLTEYAINALGEALTVGQLLDVALPYAAAYDPASSRLVDYRAAMIPTIQAAANHS